MPRSHRHDEPESPAEEAELIELRRILVQPVTDPLEKAQQAPIPADAIADALPDAVSASVGRGPELGRALSGTVRDAVRRAAREDREMFADAIFPIIGPAIRRAIAAALRELTQSMNTAVESSLTPRGIRWRLEAWRTGRSYSEVALAHAMVFRVEQVFLIHKETGLLLQHAEAEAIEAQDGDLVSGMLTAIQDFASDSFRVEEGDALEDVRIGELTVSISVGPRAVIALVIRGTAPEALRTEATEALEEIHLHHGEHLSSFEGDAQVFSPTRPLLEALLRAEHRTQEQKTPVFAIVLLAALVALVAALVWRDYVATVQFDELVQSLDNTPGIVVTDAQRVSGSYVVRGLRDPLAAAPDTIIGRGAVDPARVDAHWEPYQSLHASLVSQRATAALSPPDGVTVRIESETLVIAGTGPHAWLARALAIGPTLPGVGAVDHAGYELADKTALFDAVSRIQGASVSFDVGQVGLGAEAAPVIDLVFAQWAKLSEFTDVVGESASLQIVGYADSTGDADRNEEIATLRAEAVRLALIARGIDPEQVRTLGAGEVPNSEGQEGADARRVQFVVVGLSE